jgi:DNA polymerase III delta prime subunit
MIFPATIISSTSNSNTETKLKKICLKLKNPLSPNNPDIFIINQDIGWGIDQIRKIKHFLSQKPLVHQNKLVIIYQSEKLLPEAQNALLKNLEEPGLNNYLILLSSNHHTLLPTIISRCQLLKIDSAPVTRNSTIIIPDSFAPKALKQADELSLTKDEILPFLLDQLYLYHQHLTQNPKPSTQITLQKIIKSIKLIKANVDPKNALDYFFLS